MALKFSLTSEQRSEIMRLAAELKGNNTFDHLGAALNVHPSTLQPTVAYGRPPVLRHLLWWRINSPDASVRRWAQATLEVMGVMDEKDRRE